METTLEKLEKNLSFELDNLMASNKAFRTTLAQSVVQDITEGNLDATQALIYACKAEEFFKSVIDNVRPIVASKQIQKGGLKLYDTEIVEKKTLISMTLLYVEMLNGMNLMLYLMMLRQR